MATTYVGDGDRKTVTVGANYTGGDIYVMTAGAKGSAGVIVDTVLNGGQGVVALSGVWAVRKKAGANLDFAIGEKVYTTATGDATMTATGNTPLGIAWAAAVTGATTCQVKLVQAGGLL